MAASTSNNSKQ